MGKSCVLLNESQAALVATKMPQMRRMVASLTVPFERPLAFPVSLTSLHVNLWNARHPYGYAAASQFTEQRLISASLACAISHATVHACLQIRSASALFLSRLSSTPRFGMMFLFSLPTVLTQAIAHFLPTKDRIVLARCSRRARKCAAAAFAWLSADPVTVGIGRFLPSGPLLPFIPICLVWSRYAPDEPCANIARHILTMAHHSPIAVLHIQLRRPVDESIATQLLQAPDLQRLQELTLSPYTRRQIELACMLPRLATLKLFGLLASDDAALLAPAPSLTDLTVGHDEPGGLQAVLRCSRLHRLTIFQFHRGDFMSFSQEFVWQQLRELSLTAEVWSSVLPSDEIAVSFACLHSLLVLSIAGFHPASAVNLDCVLTHVHRIPKLRRLIIECVLGVRVGMHCSVDVLLSLLRSDSELCVEWLVPAGFSKWIESYVRPWLAQVHGKVMFIEEPKEKQSRVCIVREP